VQFDSVNSRTFKDLWNEIQGLLSTCPVFKHFQGLEFRRKKFKNFEGCVGTQVFNRICTALTFERLDLESYKKYLGQVRISRSSGQGQGHRSKKGVYPVRGWSALEWKAILFKSAR